MGFVNIALTLLLFTLLSCEEKEGVSSREVANIGIAGLTPNEYAGTPAFNFSQVDFTSAHLISFYRTGNREIILGELEIDAIAKDGRHIFKYASLFPFLNDGLKRPLSLGKGKVEIALNFSEPVRIRKFKLFFRKPLDKISLKVSGGGEYYVAEHLDELRLHLWEGDRVSFYLNETNCVWPLLPDHQGSCSAIEVYTNDFIKSPNCSVKIDGFEVLAYEREPCLEGKDALCLVFEKYTGFDRALYQLFKQDKLVRERICSKTGY